MNSENTSVDIIGERVHTDKKKKWENDHLLLHLEIQGGKINVN